MLQNFYTRLFHYICEKYSVMKVKHFPVVIMTFFSMNLLAQTKTDTVKVWGNCDECKDKIETAAKDAGAADANWSDSTYLLVVNYDASKTSSLDIQKSVAAVGYDTQDVRADDTSYKKLPKCCQYKRETEGVKQD
jgi:mercuric ion binding protein